MIPIQGNRKELAPAAEAYGKVILLGEHSVVYGRPALAAGLPQGLRLRATPLADAAAPIELAIPAWGIDLNLRPGITHPVAMAAIAVLSACRGPRQGWRITGETHLPSRAGLGSSAALTVALARLADPEASPAAIIDASMIGERLFHGEPSGLDSTLAAQGGLVRFVRGEAPVALQPPGPLPLWILPPARSPGGARDDGTPRSTGALVAGVRRRWERLPAIAEPILDALGAAALAGEAAIAAGDHPRLGEIMTIAHRLLGALGVSAEPLDRVVTLAEAHGALGAKLTGAGGGGCAIALPPPAPEAREALAAALATAGIPTIQTMIQTMIQIPKARP